LPQFQTRSHNANAWLELHQRMSFKGAVATGWSRNSTHRIQKEPIDSALDSLVNVASIFREGKPVENSKDCELLLDPLGERERFLRCKAAMKRLSEAREMGWRSVKLLRQQLALLAYDSGRKSGSQDFRFLADLKKAIAQARSSGEEMKAAFSGLIHIKWIEEYLWERIVPLEEEFRLLQSEVPDERKALLNNISP
jgi:hypothetical protein